MCTFIYIATRKKERNTPPSYTHIHTHTHAHIIENLITHSITMHDIQFNFLKTKIPYINNSSLRLHFKVNNKNRTVKKDTLNGQS